MKIIVITGSANGIGHGLASHFQANNWRVLSTDLDKTDDADHFPCDLSTETGCVDFCRFIESKTEKVDALINNAAQMKRVSPEELSLNDWNKVLHTNLTAPFLLTRELAPLLRRGLGRVVNLTSTRAHMSEPNTEAYAASKGGLLALTHALAISLGPELKVNCISPGWINSSQEELSEEDHHQHPAGRVGTVADITRLVDFLLAPENDFITGSEFVVDGGMTRKMIYE